MNAHRLRKSERVTTTKNQKIINANINKNDLVEATSHDQNNEIFFLTNLIFVKLLQMQYYNK